MLESVTLDQLRMLSAVAETGSFTAAAKHVSRAQSAVSHAIASLERQLGLTLFDRSAKWPQLTPAGQAVLNDAQAILKRADRLKARAKALASGMEAELTIAVSVVIPQDVLLSALDGLRTEFPALAVRLFVEEVGGAPQLVADGTAHLGFIGVPSLRAAPSDDFERQSIGFVDIVAVCAPDHPLAHRGMPLTDSDLADHRQLVPTSRALPRYPNRMTQDVWEIADLDVRHQMLLRGFGWGTAPLNRVDADIASGRLSQIDISARPDEAMRVPLFAIYRNDTGLGPARRWLIEKVRECSAI